MICTCRVSVSVRIKIKGLFIIILTLMSTVVFGENSIATALGWKKGSTKEGQCASCKGYYSEPVAIEEVPKPPPYKTVPVTITAKGPVIFREDGVSVLQDHVVIRQPGRLIHADKAFIYRNKKLGKITDIKLHGHVRIQEAGKLLIGTKANYDVEKNKLTINNAIYHITGRHEQLTISTPFDAWGTAKTIHRQPNDVIDLTNATYSTCPPENPSWTISADTMRLDKKEGKGTAHNVVVRFKNVPILYSPYYSFPISAARKSGFLMPDIGYGAGGTTGKGFFIAEPYYWNIAPNHDLLFTPEWYSLRGLQLNSNFRYLTSQSDGFFYASVIPHDNAYKQFKQNTLNAYENSTATGIKPYISELRNSSNDRAFFNFDNNIAFNKNWTGKFDARYVTDPYYAEDFQSEYLTQNTNQIPSFGELEYQRGHWQNTFLMQSYQTLHPLDQFNTPAQNQYTRLPELDFSAAYPQVIPDFNFNLSGQAVRFVYQSGFAPLTYQLPVGTRLHFQPSINRPFNWSSAYLTPQLTLDNTSYFSKLPASGPGIPRPKYDASRTIPIFNMDSGLYFDRSVRIGGTHYMQTLEPEFFYLYTPYVKQDEYPNFDTQLLPFSTANLYSINQFTGFDRIQNANQLSVGVTSNLLRSVDASDVLSAQLGMINYFDKRRVCLTQGCKPSSAENSPIAGALTWNPNPLWSINTQAAWDIALHQINNSQTGVQYHLSQKRVIVFDYQFIHGNPDTPFDAFGFSTDTSLLTAGLVWPLTENWHFFGYDYYDLTHGRPQNQYTGLSYSTCCWAFRFIVSNNYDGTSKIDGGQAFQNQYSTDYYVEFLLKGLGSAASRHAEDMLTSTLPGFQDAFSNRGHNIYNQNI